jgi:uncharacterized protein (TIGR03437 family)
MRRRIAFFLSLCGLSLSAADFQDFQAARAVIGQASFSAHDTGVTAVSLSFEKGILYVADERGHVFGYDVSRIGAAQTAGCPVCLTLPQSTVAQNVFQGVAAVAMNGQNIAIADAHSHQVMLWKDSMPMALTGFVNPTAVALDHERLFVGDAGSHHVFIWNQLPASAAQPPDVTLGVADFDAPAADSIQTPAALASDGVNLYVADSGARRVLVFSAAASPAPQVVNAATLTAGPVAPGTLVSIDHAGAFSSVLLNGLPLRVTETSGNQLQVQIPYELAGASSGSLLLRSETGNGAAILSRPAAVRFTMASPGIFAFGLQEPRTGLVLHAPEGIPLSAENPAKPAELLSVWATGLGAISTDANADGSFDVLTPVRASVNGEPVEVISAALPADATGVYEVRLRLPPELPAVASLILMQNDNKSNAITFPVVNH